MKLNAEIGKRVVWTVLGMLWLGGVVTGLGLLVGYDNRPGVAAQAPAAWPVESRLVLDHERPTLVMLAHPLCDCTRASVAEFAELMARAATQPKAYILFIEPTGIRRDWEKTELWRAARAIPGVTVLRDSGSVEADIFGVETSGQTLLYDVDGRLLFSGGTTGARGHVGDNEGRATILALLDHEDPQKSASSVFGCSLFGEQDVRGTQATPYASAN